MRPSNLLGLDVDETLVIGPGRAFVQFLPLFGITFDHEVYAQSRNWEKASGVSSKKLTPLYEAFMACEWCPLSQPIPGAKEFLNTFSAVAPITLITARGAATQAKTLRELNRHFGPVFAQSHFGCLGSKARVMAEQGIAILIDDSDNEAERVVAALDHVYVIKFPHYLFDVNGHSSNRSHPRIIQLAARKHLTPDMSDAERVAALVFAWEEAHMHVRELAERAWPHLLENNNLSEAVV